MKRTTIVLAVIAAFALHAEVMCSFSNVYDVLTLKDGKGVLKGFINKQVLGQYISIIPHEAVLRIDVADIQGGKPEKTTPTNGQGANECTVITRLSTGERMEGTIVALSPGKWYTLSTATLAPQVVPYDAVESIGKGVVGTDDQVFKEYGVFDVIELADGQTFRGMIVEQRIGEHLTMKLKDETQRVVVDFKDIKKIRKEPSDPKEGLFTQSPYLDVVHTLKGGVVRGIILTQIPGEYLTVEFPANSGISDPIAFSEIESIARDVNPLRKKDEEERMPVVEEPDTTGVFIYKTLGSGKPLHAYGFAKLKHRKYIKLLKAPRRLLDVFALNNPQELLLKPIGSRDDVMTTLRIRRLVDVRELRGKSKAIPLKVTSTDLDDFLSNHQGHVQFVVEPYGQASVKLLLTPQEPGTYAITYKGCRRIAVFLVE